jgi:hypothetical protein
MIRIFYAIYQSAITANIKFLTCKIIVIIMAFFLKWHLHKINVQQINNDEVRCNVKKMKLEVAKVSQIFAEGGIHLLQEFHDQTR